VGSSVQSDSLVSYKEGPVWPGGFRFGLAVVGNLCAEMQNRFG